MPEVRLGIVPGAGGTQRLPRLIGPAAAVKMLLTAETIEVERARQWGLVDEVCPAEQLVHRACERARTPGEPRRTSRQTARIQDATAREAGAGEAQRLLADLRPELIAPRKIWEAVKTGWEESFHAGLACERQGFDACMRSLETRNKIYLFFATRQTSKIAELAGLETTPLSRAAVIGMGAMGAGIALALILAEVKTVVLDRSENALTTGWQKIRESIGKRVRQGRLSRPRAERILTLLSTTTDWDDLARSDLVIESVFEDADAKRSVMGRLEEVCPRRTILASNTSTIPLEELAAPLRQPQRLIGMHFFNPADRMPLVEIVRCDRTPREILATAISWSKKLRKTPVLVASRAGFLVSRVFVPYLQEAFQLLEEGATPAAVDRAAVEFGFPMGPLALMDMTGLDILTDSQRVLASALPRHESLSPIAACLVQRGQLGQKAGAGVYRYEAGSFVPLDCDATENVIAEVRHQVGCTARAIGQREIQERLVLRMACESFYVLEEGVARSQSDVDVATVLGIGFPDFRGGVLKYAHDRGLRQVREQLVDYSTRFGKRFSPSSLMQKLEGVS